MCPNLVTFFIIASLFLLVASAAAFVASVRSSTRYWKQLYKDDYECARHKRAD